ncbi:enoyl-CoA hydratase/isomerase family protein [Loktanella sp. Alg231-35]|uniref:enoyl-CoA hydratase/isomerase family protein n=1 Tax=Loktanella sp. Alg231-35 TaxID=1922220 RepID=UPI000D55A149|nr:enoyl-CoA hydratase/isomerase family protein [Loktanella sp. Alg231-35]
MTDINIRKSGRAGWITLNRPKALNALTWDMCLAIEQALDDWRDDHEVALVIVDAAGDRAFCSGGDIAEMYAAGQRGDLDYGRRFWRDEYRLNAKVHSYPKPVVSFLQGFTMGGGVGVGCHAAHRIVCDSSQIAMPECAIGLVPDVGGSLLLARAPGHVGTYLGLTGDRMDAGDAIFAGFADHYVPETAWEALKQNLATSGTTDAIATVKHPAPDSRLADWQADIDICFVGPTLAAVYQAMPADAGLAIEQARKLMGRNCPLSMAVSAQIIDAVCRDQRITTALDHEFRYTFRCVAQGDFIEGIRAAIIDRDRSPQWQHSTWTGVTDTDVAAMTAPLGKDALQWEDKI